MSAPGLASPFCLWRLQELPCVSGVFAYHEHVSHAWVYKMKYVTISSWKQEPWLSLLPHYCLNLSALLNEPVGFSCPTAQCLLGRRLADKKPPAGGTGEWPGACMGKEPSSPSWPRSVVAQLS